MILRISWNAARILLLALVAVGTFPSAHAQLSRTPAVGSPERKAILDVIRAVVEPDLRQKVVFKVSLLNVAGNWAAARVTPIRPNGSDIDYRKTKYRADDEEGAFDGEGEALLRRRGGEWSLVKWRFGASDTELSIWIDELGAPSSLAISE